MSDPTHVRTVRSARFAVRRARTVIAQPWFGVGTPQTNHAPIEITRLDALTRLNFYDEHATPAEANMPRGCFATIDGATVHLG